MKPCVLLAASLSLLWGPVAASIVRGLGFPIVLTLFVMPLLYWIFMRRFSGVAR